MSSLYFVGYDKIVYPFDVNKVANMSQTTIFTRELQF